MSIKVPSSWYVVPYLCAGRVALGPFCMPCKAAAVRQPSGRRMMPRYIATVEICVRVLCNTHIRIARAQ